MVMTSVRVPEKLMIRLQRAANKLDRSKSWVINQALRQYMGRLEFRERLLEELQREESGSQHDQALMEWLTGNTKAIEFSLPSHQIPKKNEVSSD